MTLPKNVRIYKNTRIRTYIAYYQFRRIIFVYKMYTILFPYKTTTVVFEKLTLFPRTLYSYAVREGVPPPLRRQMTRSHSAMGTELEHIFNEFLVDWLPGYNIRPLMHRTRSALVKDFGV